MTSPLRVASGEGRGRPRRPGARCRRRQSREPDEGGGGGERQAAGRRRSRRPRAPMSPRRRRPCWRVRVGGVRRGLGREGGRPGARGAGGRRSRAGHDGRRGGGGGGGRVAPRTSRSRGKPTHEPAHEPAGSTQPWQPAAQRNGGLGRRRSRLLWAATVVELTAAKVAVGAAAPTKTGSPCREHGGEDTLAKEEGGALGANGALMTLSSCPLLAATLTRSNERMPGERGRLAWWVRWRCQQLVPVSPSLPSCASLSLGGGRPRTPAQWHSPSRPPSSRWQRRPKQRRGAGQRR